MIRALVVLLVAGLALLWLAAGAHADTSATCTTDTATSYCDSIATGANSGAAVQGFALAEAIMGVLLGFFWGLWVFRRLLGASGWGS